MSWSPGKLGRAAGPGPRTAQARCRSDHQRGDGQQDGRQAQRDRPGRGAYDKDVPAVDGDLDGSVHRDHARGQLTVLDGDPEPGLPGSGAGAQQSGCLAAQPRNRVPPGPS